jgi:oligopeptide transport system ATP-binding protein
MAKPLLQIERLSVEFRTDDAVIQAVNEVSFSLAAGETLGIVGESGSGKSVTSLALMGLIPQPPGKITQGRAMFHEQDLLSLPLSELRKIRGKRIAMIFQDPMTALNPFLTVGEQLTEITRLHLGHSASVARKKAIEVLEQVGIPGAGDRLDDYPHQFSGGMRQRVMIAMALSCNPEILIADEPTTALDVTIQAQILELIQSLQKQHGTAVMLITHALGIVANLCQRVIVMYGGRIVEQGPVESMFYEPCHPYTLGLLDSIPRDDDRTTGRLRTIEGQPPNMGHPPPGCTFHPRCRFRKPECEQTMPALLPRAAGGEYRCLLNIAELGGISPLKLAEEHRGE